MPQAAGPSSQEYWRPSNPEVARVIPSIRGICWQCGMDYSAGARFCHVCGGARERRSSGVATLQPEPVARRDAAFITLYQRLGLSKACLACLAVGLLFVLAALMTGVIYKVETFADWQAVQTWRIEWLLASAVTLLTGILLKKA